MMISKSLVTLEGNLGHSLTKKNLTFANQSSDPDSNSSSAKIRLLSGGGRSKMTS